MRISDWSSDVCSSDLAGHVDAPPEQRGDEAALARLLLHRLHVGADAGIALEVGVDVGARLALGDGEVLRQTEGRDAIDDAEVDGFRLAADHRDRKSTRLNSSH